MAELERRILAVEGLRAERREDGTAIITGHAAVFGQLSEDLGGFREQIAAGAFTESLQKDDIRAVWNHNDDIVLGRNRSKTLELAEDARGLAIRIFPPDTQTVRDLVLAPIERGDVSQMSFAFSVRPGGQDWAKNDDGQVIRTLKNLRTYEVSPVTFPAYPQTDVVIAQRSMKSYLEDLDALTAEAWRAGIALRRRRLALIS